MNKALIAGLLAVCLAGCGSLKLVPQETGGGVHTGSVADGAAEAPKPQDAWAVADGLFELGAGIAGLFGGACAARLVRAVDQARTKSKALREIVEGNELFKKRNPSLATDFKQAHDGQSNQTRQLVASLK